MQEKQKVSQNYADGKNFYIFDEIDELFAKDIIAPFIKEVERQKSLSNKDCVNIYISTYGGLLRYAFDLVAHIEDAKNSGVNVNTYVTSTACSAGSVIAVTGTTRYVGSRAHFLLHYARGWEYAHNPTMVKRNTENSLFLQKELVNIYAKYTKLTKIEEKLKEDNYYINGGANLIKLGLADKIIGS